MIVFFDRSWAFRFLVENIYSKSSAKGWGQKN
jgi:polyphosphate kinase 2 (PPK2 family)